MQKFKTVGVGGTFDEFHKGHRTLLLKAFDMGENVIIGVSSDEFVRKMNKPHITASYMQRVKKLKIFLKRKGLLTRAKIIPIGDATGGVLLSRDLIEALVVSNETKTTAVSFNRKRKEMGLPPLRIIVIGMIPSENNIAISTTRIRKGEIDHEGRLVRLN